MLKFDNICKTFNPGTPDAAVVFQNFNLELEKGEFLAIVGSNGSGKTTLLNILCGSIPADGGRILLAGEDITRQKEHRRAAKMGRVFQDPSRGVCPSLTVLENMALADRKGRAYGLSWGVDKKRRGYYQQQLERLHLGLENRLGQKVGSLSGGQRQALALLLATMTPIDILVLDEHTAALDPKSSENVMRLTDELVREKGLTTIMVTHNLKYAVEYGSRLIMMHGGAIVEDRGGAEKQKLAVADLLGVFNAISVECGN